MVAEPKKSWLCAAPRMPGITIGSSELRWLKSQVVRKLPQFDSASPAFLAHPKRVRLLTAVNAAMADAGIAAWHWKYEYDVWRPILGIREADAGWGPTGTGDGNT